MKKTLFVAVMLAALCAVAQQSSQPKSNDQPAQPQPASQPAQPKSDNAGQPQADKKAQLSDRNAASDKNPVADKDAAKPQTATTPAAAPLALDRIPVVCLEHTAWWVHMDPTWTFMGGDLTLGDDSIQLRCPGKSLNAPFGDIKSIERKSAPAGVPYLRLVARNGKKFDFFPAQAGGLFQRAGDETLAAIEKAIKDRASQHGVVLK